jgi:hypothetical protein
LITSKGYSIPAYFGTSDGLALAVSFIVKPMTREMMAPAAEPIAREAKKFASKSGCE